jgi:hypothetical protein
MTLEEFAQIHGLNEEWLKLRRECNEVVAQPDFWYREDLKNRAREIAVKASDILKAAVKSKTNKPK